MSNNENPLSESGASSQGETRKVQFEQERISRRAALRKLGFGAGMAALLALSADDLARMAAVRLKQRAGDSRVADQIAREFRNVGIAFADPSNPSNPSGASSFRDPCTKPYRPLDCSYCYNEGTAACAKCCETAPNANPIPGGGTGGGCGTSNQDCLKACYKSCGA